MIKISPINLLVIIKNFFLVLVFYILNRKRFTINNHIKSSRELTLIKQYAYYEEPNRYLLEFVSNIYKDYINFCRNFKSPSKKY